MDALTAPLPTRSDFTLPPVRGDAMRVAAPSAPEVARPAEVRVSISAEARAALASADSVSGPSVTAASGTPTDTNARSAAEAIKQAEAKGTSTIQENPALALYLRNASVPDDRAPTSPLRTSA